MVQISNVQQRFVVRMAACTVRCVSKRLENLKLASLKQHVGSGAAAVCCRDTALKGSVFYKLVEVRASALAIRVLICRLYSCAQPGIVAHPVMSTDFMTSLPGYCQ